MTPGKPEDVALVDGYLVPVDPADETGCESCQ